MKRFQSRIESLRRVREQAEQLAKLQAAVCQQEKHAADERFAQITNQITSVAAAGRQGLQEGQVEIMQSFISTTARLEAEQLLAAAQKRAAMNKLQAAIQGVAKAQSEVKIADKHIERERTEHRRQTLVDEENDRTENTAQRFMRR